MPNPARPSAPGPEAAPSPWRRRIGWFARHRWFSVAAALAVALFGAVLTQGTGKLLVPEFFGDFYDHQAASLLRGKLDVPPAAIAFEAFVRDGKSYGYFGLTPALLRLPWAILGIGTGELTRLHLLAYFILALWAGYLVLLEASRLLTKRERPAPFVVILFVAHAGLGSTLFFLASRAYVYHEAILAGVAFALVSVWGSLRYLHSPLGRGWLVALAGGLLSLHARPPTGLFALTVLALAAVAVALRERRNRTAGSPMPGLRRPLAIAAAAVLGVGSFNAVSFLKFGTFEGCPLRLNVQYSPQRLAKIDGRQFHVTNLPFSFTAYLVAPGVESVPHFPYFKPVAAVPEHFPRAKIDLAEPMVGLPCAMPGLCLAALVGLAVVAAGRTGLLSAAVLWLGVLPMGLSLFAAIAVSHRYTADFAPFLIAAAAFGFAGWEQLRGILRLIVAVVFGAATAAALPLTTLLTLHHQGEEVWGVPDQVRLRYAALRQTADQLLGTPRPAGYDVGRLPVRQTDAAILNWTAARLETDPAQRRRTIALYERSTELVPDNPLVQANLAALLVAEGRETEAIVRLRKAVELAPTFAAAHHSLGLAYSKTGRRAEAIAAFEAALRANPNFHAARRQLESLGADGR